MERVVNIRGLLDEAKSSLCIGWDSCERRMDPGKVLEALCSVQSALEELQLLEGNLEREDAGREDAEKVNDSGVSHRPSKTPDDDLEPSIGDVVEEPEKCTLIETHTTGDGKDDPVELARALQTKARRQ